MVEGGNTAPWTGTGQIGDRGVGKCGIKNNMFFLFIKYFRKLKTSKRGTL